MSDFISDDSWCCGTRKLIEDDLRDLRAQLARVTAERDEARARIARYVAARDVLTGAGQWNPIRYVEAERACDAALAALRETPAGEGEQ